jgi:phosphatidylserine decarboxylase
MEIGALSVGRIVPAHPFDRSFANGEERCVFRFGGSAIAVFGEPRRWRPPRSQHGQGGRDADPPRRDRGRL